MEREVGRSERLEAWRAASDHHFATASVIEMGMGTPRCSPRWRVAVCPTTGCRRCGDAHEVERPRSCWIRRHAWAGRHLPEGK